ncbi:MAG: hypothetical protein LBK23_04700 [Oscillospiraceae bacterium]|jgi:hypothetical protein|nr:hypothetical protein [Oscillospiraceae bacterium]
MIKLKIQSEQDRLAVAVILVKNGYRVSQRKDADSSGKTARFALYVESALSVSEAAREKEEQ